MTPICEICHMPITPTRDNDGLTSVCEVCGDCGFCERCAEPAIHDCEREIMTFDELNARLAEILPRYHFTKGYRGALWIHGPGYNSCARLNKDGSLIRGSRAAITPTEAQQIGALVKEYRECLK